MKVYKCIRIRKMYCIVLPAAVLSLLCGLFLSFSLISGNDSNSDEGIALPVIMYHSICPGKSSEYSVTPEQAENDLAWLRSHGYTSVTAGQLIDYAYGKGSLPDKPVLITLDDGFYNNLSCFLPLLEKYDMHAVVSIVGKYTSELAAADPHCDAYSYLTWEDCDELLKSGRFEIGNHTFDMHNASGARKGCAIAAGESAEDYASALMSDVGLMQSEITEHTGVCPVVFAYPFGSVCRESIPVLRDAGFMMTLTCREKINTITRDPDCLIGIGRFNRSGLVSTGDFMSRIADSY